jgi:hypothetical protein
MKWSLQLKMSRLSIELEPVNESWADHLSWIRRKQIKLAQKSDRQSILTVRCYGGDNCGSFEEELGGAVAAVRLRPKSATAAWLMKKSATAARSSLVMKDSAAVVLSKQKLAAAVRLMKKSTVAAR